MENQRSGIFLIGRMAIMSTVGRVGGIDNDGRNFNLLIKTRILES